MASQPRPLPAQTVGTNRQTTETTRAKRGNFFFFFFFFFCVGVKKVVVVGKEERLRGMRVSVVDESLLFSLLEVQRGQNCRAEQGRAGTKEETSKSRKKKGRENNKDDGDGASSPPVKLATTLSGMI